MQILIVGAGAVGGFYGAKLALAEKETVFLARGKALAALQGRPLVVRSFRADFSARVRAVENLAGLPAQDLIILCVKCYDTDAVLRQIRPVVGPGSILISLQNGVENERKMAAAFGAEKVLGCVCYIGAEAVEPGVVVHSARGSVALGEMNGRVTDRLRGLVALFQKATIDAALSTEIQKDLWKKLAWNSAFSQICTVARTAVGPIIDSAETNLLLRETMKEVFAVARGNGVAIEEEVVEKVMRLSADDLRAVRPSMLQDLERGRRVEHESFGGFLVREGRPLGIPTPVNAVLYNLLCFLSGAAGGGRG